MEVMGVEPTTSSMRPRRSSQLSYTPKECDRIAADLLAGESAHSGRFHSVVPSWFHTERDNTLGSQSGPIEVGSLCPQPLTARGRGHCDHIQSEQAVNSDLHEDEYPTDGCRCEKAQHCSSNQGSQNFLAALLSS